MTSICFFLWFYLFLTFVRIPSIVEALLDGSFDLSLQKKKKTENKSIIRWKFHLEIICSARSEEGWDEAERIVQQVERISLGSVRSHTGGDFRDLKFQRTCRASRPFNTYPLVLHEGEEILQYDGEQEQELNDCNEKRSHLTPSHKETPTWRLGGSRGWQDVGGGGRVWDLPETFSVE